MTSPIDESTIQATIEKLIENFGSGDSSLIDKGVRQVAALWRDSDGDREEFNSFVVGHFVGDPAERELVFEKISRNMEILYGHFNKMVLDLQVPLHLDVGPIHPIDHVFGAYSPGVHLSEDFYQNKIAFTIALNFPPYSLAEKSKLGPSWSRKQWAYARLGDMFTSRVPQELKKDY